MYPLGLLEIREQLLEMCWRKDVDVQPGKSIISYKKILVYFHKCEDGQAARCFLGELLSVYASTKTLVLKPWPENV